jgi:hypothetical protein
MFIILGLLVLGSATIVVRMWRVRGDRSKFWRAAHGGQVGKRTPKLRRWMEGGE